MGILINICNLGEANKIGKMKLAFALLVIWAISANSHAWDLKCGLDSFQFKGEASDFPGWSAAEINLGVCKLAVGTYELSKTYKECGMTVEEDGDLLNIKANLFSDPITSVITRKRPVELGIGCTFHKATQVSALTPVQAIIGQIGGLVTKQGKPMPFTMKYVNIDGGNMVSDDSP